MKLLFLFIFSLPIFSQAGPFGFTQTKLSLYDQTSYVLINNNFDGNGNMVSVNGYQMQELKTVVGGSYDITSFLGIHADVNIKQVQTQSPFYKYTTTGAGEFSFGGGIQVFDFGFKLTAVEKLETRMRAETHQTH